MEYKGKLIGIYKITNPKGKVYVGQSININHRKAEYRTLQCKGQPKIFNSLKKYGWDNHKFEIIEECPIEKLDEREVYWKQYYKNQGGVLFCEIFDLGGGPKSNLTKAKISASARNKNKVNTYFTNGEYICTFNSPSEAKNVLYPFIKNDLSGILNSCKRAKQKTVNMFIFQYTHDDEINEVLEELKSNKKINTKGVSQFSKDGTFIKDYLNSYQAEKELKELGIKINSTDIRACCNNKQKTSGGFIWKFCEKTNDINVTKDEIINLYEEYKKSSYIFSDEDNFFKYIRSQTNAKRTTLEDVQLYFPTLHIGFNYIDLKDAATRSKSHWRNIFKKYTKSNIHIIQIYSDEWINKQAIVKSRIRNIFKNNNTKIYARKCEIREVAVDTKNAFLEQNHIQGKDRSKIKLGLYYKDELVSLMTFNKPRLAIGKNKEIAEDTYELLRFCSALNTNIVGGASRLFKHFIKIYKPKEVYSFADNRWSSLNMNLYKAIDFQYISVSSQGYYYTNDFQTRLHRFNFNKTRLAKQGYDISKTETQIMKENGYHIIWDCGVARYSYKS